MPKAKRESTAMFHSQQLGIYSLPENLARLESHEADLARELRQVQSQRRKLSAAVIKANRARWAAERLAAKLDRELQGV